jgi:hypothetical protein
MAAPLNTCTTIEQRGVVRFLWGKNMDAAKDIRKEMLPLLSICSVLIDEWLMVMWETWWKICYIFQNKNSYFAFSEKKCNENPKLWLKPGIYCTEQQPLMGQGFLIIEDWRSHSDTPLTVELLWTSDQPDSETSTWQHTTLTRERDRHDSGEIRTLNTSKRAATNPGRRPRCHCDWLSPSVFSIKSRRVRRSIVVLKCTLPVLFPHNHRENLKYLDWQYQLIKLSILFSLRYGQAMNSWQISCRYVSRGLLQSLRTVLRDLGLIGSFLNCFFDQWCPSSD